ncbi:MAG: hypothetical protein WKF30_12975 [Pyrinomonadaceae bacterium]
MRKRLISGIAACLGLLLSSGSLTPVLTRSQTPRLAQPEAQRIERLIALCKLWAAVKYFHPYLAYRDIDWDGALVAAIPKVNAAHSPKEYAAAIQTMLDALGDPAPRVAGSPSVQPEAQTTDAAPAGNQREHDPRSRLDENGILIITVSNYDDLIDFPGTEKKWQAIGAEAAKARGIVFDLRAAAPLPESAEGYLSYYLSNPLIARKFAPVPLVMPGERRRMHSGFAPQEGHSSGGYYSAFFTTDGARIAPEKNAQEDVPSVFLVNRHSELPAFALALQSAGKAIVIAEGGAPSDAATVTTQTFEMREGVRVVMRLGELINADGGGGLHADTIVAARLPDQEDQALRAALSAAKDFKAPSGPRRPPLITLAASPSDKTYPEMSYPSIEYRLLAAFRVWAVINYFFAYKDLMKEDWDGVLREFIPKLEQAADETSYALTIAEMTARTHDTHVSVGSPTFNKIFGTAPAPVLIRMIEKMPVVTRALDEEAVKAAGLEVGDVMLKVDGERIEERIARLSKYLAASTPQALDYRIASRLLRGAEGSTVTLTIRNRSGSEREVKLPRREEYLKAYTSERTGDIVKTLAGNIGYADLNRLTVSEVDGMFERFKDTKAIIFDMRGYPKGTAWAIAPRLTEVPAPRPRSSSGHWLCRPTVSIEKVQR